jgi:hypothetical protein
MDMLSPADSARGSRAAVAVCRFASAWCPLARAAEAAGARRRWRALPTPAWDSMAPSPLDKALCFAQRSPGGCVRRRLHGRRAAGWHLPQGRAGVGAPPGPGPAQGWLQRARSTDTYTRGIEGNASAALLGPRATGRRRIGGVAGVHGAAKGGGKPRQRAAQRAGPGLAGLARGQGGGRGDVGAQRRRQQRVGCAAGHAGALPQLGTRLSDTRHGAVRGGRPRRAAREWRASAGNRSGRAGGGRPGHARGWASGGGAHTSAPKVRIGSTRARCRRVRREKSLMPLSRQRASSCARLAAAVRCSVAASMPLVECSTIPR